MRASKQADMAKHVTRTCGIAAGMIVLCGGDTSHFLVIVSAQTYTYVQTLLQSLPSNSKNFYILCK